MDRTYCEDENACVAAFVLSPDASDENPLEVQNTEAQRTAVLWAPQSDGNLLGEGMMKNALDGDQRNHRDSSLTNSQAVGLLQAQHLEVHVYALRYRADNSCQGALCHGAENARAVQNLTHKEEVAPPKHSYPKSCPLNQGKIGFVVETSDRHQRMSWIARMICC